MKLTSEILKKICDDYGIREGNKEKLIKTFLAEYPDTELTEKKYNYKEGKGVDYSSEDGRLILKLETPTLADNNECIPSMGAAYFHGKDFTRIFLKSGYDRSFPQRSTKIVAKDDKVRKRWPEKIKDIFFHAR